MAWVTATPELVAAVRTAKQDLAYVSAGPFPYAVAEALRLPDSYFFITTDLAPFGEKDAVLIEAVDRLRCLAER